MEATEKQEKISKAKPCSWKPGQSGNPDGRPPKGYSISEMMKEMLANDPAKKKALGEAIYQKAMAGDVTAMKTLWNYMDGMPVQGIEHSGKDGEAIDVNHTIQFVKP